MIRKAILTVLLAFGSLTLAACETGSLAGPSPTGDVASWIAALRGDGATVTAGAPISGSAYPFFGALPQPFVVNTQPVTAFEYASADAAAADAARISPDGQPSPTAIVEWISTPRFYRRDRLLVLYVGCASTVIQPLDRTLGAAFVIGRVPCSR